MKAKKPSKRVQVNMRLLPDEPVAFRRAAKAKGLSVTVWLRTLARQASGLESAELPPNGDS